MPAVGALKRLKNGFKKLKNIGKKVFKFVKDKGIDMAVQGIKFLKNGKLDLVLNLVKSFIPQAAIASEVVERLKILLNKVDEDKLKDILKKTLNGDLSELRNLSNVYIKDDDENNLNSHNKYFGNSIN